MLAETPQNTHQTVFRLAPCAQSRLLAFHMPDEVRRPLLSVHTDVPGTSYAGEGNAEPRALTVGEFAAARARSDVVSVGACYARAGKRMQCWGRACVAGWGACEGR